MYQISTITFIGLPHIHGVAWIDPEWLKEFGITGKLVDHPEKTAELADMLVSCSINTDDAELNENVKSVQRHSHSKTCQKYGTSCRFGFPKLPSKHTMIAKPLPDDMDPDTKKKTLKKVEDILKNAKDLLESDGIKEDMSIDEFISKLGVTDEEYHQAVGTMEKGTQLILKRQVSERFINYYNREVQKAWIANTDFQLAFDTYSIVTYMISYVGKDDTGMTKFLTEALHANASAPLEEKLRAIKLAYLKNKQISGSEAVYRVLPSMHMRDSNIATEFIQTGFKEDRSVKYNCIDPEGNSSSEDSSVNDEGTTDEIEQQGDIVQIAGKSGRYRKSKPVHDRYSERPACVEEISLAQFASHYDFAGKRVPESVVFDDNGASEEPSDRMIFDTETVLPKYLKLKGNNNEFMRLRANPKIIRIHRSEKKEGHAMHYSELLLYVPWRDEEKEFHRYDADKCIDEYSRHSSIIQSIKKQIFLGEDTVEMLDCDMKELPRPTHMYAMIDPQAEQDLDDDLDEGVTDDPRYAARDYDSAILEDGPKYDSFKYKQVELPDDDSLDKLTRRLVDEQMVILLRIIHYCKEVVKCIHAPHESPTPVRLIVHGGAGVGKSAVIKVIAFHAEKILRKAGDHPNKPRVLICAFTGKAASLIDGQTLHSTFDFKFGNEHKTLSDRKRAILRDLLSEVKIIIIDEVSLIKADMLFQVHARLSEIFQCNDLFANKSVILVGDLLQLPPVKGNFVFDKPFNDNFAAYDNAMHVWKSFEPYLLRHIHRQSEQREWADVLNQLRIGNVTDEAKQLLETRVTKEEHLHDKAMHVMYTNQEVHDLNTKMLNKIDKPMVELQAIKRGPPGYKFSIRQWGTIDSTQFMDKLYLKVGARVSLAWNVNTMDHLVNGAIGTIVGFERDKASKIEAVVVVFDNKKAGRMQREQYPIISDKYKSENGTPIKIQEMEYYATSQRGKSQAARPKIWQFPLRLAWANTSHK